jgi:FHS family glucose/mannose:H+ symporter-like MFS transporter
MKNNSFINYLLEFPNFLALFIFSFFMVMASPILINISEYFGVTPENMNIITTFFLIGQVLGIITFVFLSRKLKGSKIIISSYILLFPALTCLVLTASLIFFYILYFISGLLLGIIFMNANISMFEGRVENKDSVVNLGHGFFAMGALISPIFASNIVNRQMNWRVIYLVFMGLTFISFISFLLTNRERAGALDKRVALPLKELFRNRSKNIYIIFTVTMMLLYIMSEVTIFSWAPTFFRIDKLFDIYSAGLMISIFWIGILVGRLLVSFLSYKIKAGTLLIFLSIISIVGLVVAIFSANKIIIFIGVGIIGLGFSGIPPLLISSAGKIFSLGKEVPLTILFSIGITGGSLIPFVIKLIADYNFLFSIAISIVFMAIFIVFVFVRKTYRKKMR